MPKPDRQRILFVATAHGQIAAAIAEYRFKAAGGGPNKGSEPVIDAEVLAISGHVMERECKEMQAQYYLKHKPDATYEQARQGANDWVYCW